MKLTVILSISEYHDDVASLLDQSGIRRFSTVGIRGFKKGKHTDLKSWFGEHSPHIKTNSIMFLCFTTDEEASRLISNVDECNLNCMNSFPVHAFVLDVEKNSKLL